MGRTNSGLLVPDHALPPPEEPKIAPKSDPLTDSAPILAKYRVPSGKMLVVRDRVDMETVRDNEYLVAKRVQGLDGNERAILDGAQWRADTAQMFAPWATVLLIGAPYTTDYGTVIQPPDVVPGQRVLIAATGGDNFPLSAGGLTLELTLIGFRGVVLIEEMDA